MNRKKRYNKPNDTIMIEKGSNHSSGYRYRYRYRCRIIISFKLSVSSSWFPSK